MIIIIISRTCVTKRITFLPVQALDTQLFLFVLPLSKATHTQKETRRQEKKKKKKPLLASFTLVLSHLLIVEKPSFSLLS
jgi:hypothetical protein